MSASERVEKSWSAVLVAVRTHHKGLVGEGIVDEDRVRLTVSARAEEAKTLTKPIAEGGKGLSKRQAAKVLGVSHQTINNDLLAPARAGAGAEGNLASFAGSEAAARALSAGLAVDAHSKWGAARCPHG
jgi:hypothetical protein